MRQRARERREREAACEKQIDREIGRERVCGREQESKRVRQRAREQEREESEREREERERERERED